MRLGFPSVADPFAKITNPSAPAAIICFVAFFLLVTPSSDAASGRGKWSWTAGFGLMSYTLYLSHFEFGMALTPIASRMFPDWRLALAACLIVVFLTAFLVMSGPERWLQHAGRRLLLPKAAPSPGKITVAGLQAPD